MTNEVSAWRACNAVDHDWHNISQYMPFGGYEQSGAGREMGPGALDAFTEEKRSRST